MDWQQFVSLVIVAGAALALTRGRLRRRKFSFARPLPCGCSPVREAAPRGSIVFHARKGCRPQILMKLK